MDQCPAEHGRTSRCSSKLKSVKGNLLFVHSTLANTERERNAQEVQSSQSTGSGSAHDRAICSLCEQRPTERCLPRSPRWIHIIPMLRQLLLAPCACGDGQKAAKRFRSLLCPPHAHTPWLCKHCGVVRRLNLASAALHDEINNSAHRMLGAVAAPDARKLLMTGILACLP